MLQVNDQRPEAFFPVVFCMRPVKDATGTVSKNKNNTKGGFSKEGKMEDTPMVPPFVQLSLHKTKLLPQQVSASGIWSVSV